MKKIQASVQALSGDELQMIHRGSLRLLERVGVRMPHAECLGACRRAGARVDEPSETVYFPASLLEDFLQQFRRQAPTDSPTDSPSALSGVISTQVHLVDYTSQTRRHGMLEDVRKGIALVQQLENFPTANAVVIPSDAPSELTDVFSFQLIYSYSKKPGGTYVLTPFAARHVVSMAQVMSRSVWFLIDPVSPLQFRKENLEIASIFARAGHILYIGSMVMAGATGPVTLAGTLTVHNAELLASLFLVHALTGRFEHEVYNSGPHSMDPRTMICSFGSANQALFGIAMAQLGRFYGMQRVANVGLTDALRPDFQCGFEKGASAVFSLLAGVQKIGCQGLVGADQGFSFEQLVIDNEWLGFCNYVLKGFEVTEQTLAAELVEMIGKGGNFLTEEHTARNFRKNMYQSKLFNREAWEAWLQSGGKDTLMQAHRLVEEKTANYAAAEPVCTSQQFGELNRIVTTAREELGKMQ
jgi:trimethylamine--corrinoid protein Co-methyltransferase